MTTSADWTVQTVRGTVAQLHRRIVPSPPSRQVWLFEPTDGALVLGSTQSVAVVDGNAVETAGLSIVRRASGGGAVVVSATDITWFDVVLPVGDPLWNDDVGLASLWLGELCATVLGDLGCDVGRPERRTVRSAWSSLVCFAGLGPGELAIDGRKVLGISQRRTREAARFQVSVLQRLDALGTAGLFLLDPGEQKELAGALEQSASPVGVDQSVVRAALRSAFSAH